MSPLVAFLSLLQHVETRMATTRYRQAPARTPHPPSAGGPIDNATRVHVDGSHRRDRWTYRDEACGWVLEGLPSINRMGRPAGIARETIDGLWPIKASALRRMFNPAEAEADRRARQFRSVRR